MGLDHLRELWSGEELLLMGTHVECARAGIGARPASETSPHARAIAANQEGRRATWAPAFTAPDNCQKFPNTKEVTVPDID